jgi:inorganic phosphate transporter, PiT family
VPITVPLIIALALLFDFLNGMNDAANSVATIVSTRVLSPRFAVLWAAFFNVIAVLFFGVHVAKTIGKGVIDPTIVTNELLLATLIGAILWTHACTHFGLPISVSHALVGGLLGAGFAAAGVDALKMHGLLKILAFIVISPVLGMFLGYWLMVALYWICRRQNPPSVNRWFRRLQLVSAAAYSLGHGSNDAQKTMGIIALTLYSNGYLGGEFHVPVWVIVSCYLAIGFGTLAGGWKVIRTLGMKMTKLKPIHGFAAETAAATSIIFSSLLGMPVSTTHTITGSIIGVGATSKLSAVRWGVAIRIVWAWVLTIPGSALMSWALYEGMHAAGLKLP